VLPAPLSPIPSSLFSSSAPASADNRQAVKGGSTQAQNTLGPGESPSSAGSPSPSSNASLNGAAHNQGPATEHKSSSSPARQTQGQGQGQAQGQGQGQAQGQGQGQAQGQGQGQAQGQGQGQGQGPLEAALKGWAKLPEPACAPRQPGVRPPLTSTPCSPRGAHDLLPHPKRYALVQYTPRHTQATPMPHPPPLLLLTQRGKHPGTPTPCPHLLLWLARGARS